MARVGPDRMGENSVSPVDRIIEGASKISLDRPPQETQKYRGFTVVQEHQDLVAYRLYLNRTEGKRPSTQDEKDEDALRAKLYLHSKQFTQEQFEALDEEVRAKRRGDNNRSNPATRRFLATASMEFNWDDM